MRFRLEVEDRRGAILPLRRSYILLNTRQMARLTITFISVPSRCFFPVSGFAYDTFHKRLLLMLPEPAQRRPGFVHRLDSSISEIESSAAKRLFTEKVIGNLTQ